MQLQIQTEKSFRGLSLQLQYTPKDFYTFKEIQHQKQLTPIIIILCLSTMYFGSCLAYMSTCSQALLAEYFGSLMMNFNYYGPIHGFIAFGAAIGVGVCKYTMDNFTRRHYLMILNLIHLVVLGLLQINNIYLFAALRLCQGIVVGNYMILIPTYINQLTPLERRIKYALFPQISVVMGVILVYSLGVIYQDNNVPNYLFWRLQFIFPLIPTSIQIFLIITKYIPQSPLSLLKLGYRQQAVAIISHYYDEKTVIHYMDQYEQIAYTSKNIRKQKQKQMNYSKKAIFIGFSLAVMYQWTGIISIVTQVGHIISLQLSKHNVLVARYTPVGINIAQLIGTFLSFLILTKFQLKKTILVAGYIITLLLCMLGILFLHLDWAPSVYLTSAVLSIYMFVFGLTLGTVLWPYARLVLPVHMVTEAITLNWICSGVTIVLFEYIAQIFHSPYLIFFIFMGVTFLVTSINAFLMINVKGLTKKQIVQNLR